MDEILDYIKQIIQYAADKHRFKLIEFGSENEDHIHIAIQLMPLQSVSTIVQLLKQYTRFYVWEYYAPILRQFYWYDDFLWSKGYYCSTMENVSKEKILEYVEKQNY